MEFGKIADKIKDMPTLLSYWVEEDNIIKKKMKENEELHKLITMSYEKFHQEFTI